MRTQLSIKTELLGFLKANGHTRSETLVCFDIICDENVNVQLQTVVSLVILCFWQTIWFCVFLEMSLLHTHTHTLHRVAINSKGKQQTV